MEKLKSENEKSENDEIITLRFAKELKADIRSEDMIKENFRPRQKDISQDFTHEEINSINKIICLGNKITKGDEDKKNNSGDRYNDGAKIIFEPGREYEITKSDFEQLRKVFWLGDNFLKMNRKIEFEFADTRKVKMRSAAQLSIAVNNLLKKNSIKTNIVKDQGRIMILEKGKKYYFTVNEFELLNKGFYMDEVYPSLTSNCIHKNIFDMPLDILISFVSGYNDLDYPEYVFKERAKKNTETKRNGISYDLWSQLVDIKEKYKTLGKIIEEIEAIKKFQAVRTNDSINEINKIKEIIKKYGFSEPDENQLIEMLKVPDKLDEYFTNETINKMKEMINKYDFSEPDENQLVEMLKVPGKLDKYFTNETINKMKKIIKKYGFSEPDENQLDEMLKVPTKLGKYFANETVNKINRKIKQYGFKELQSENQLVKTFKLSLTNNPFSSEDIEIILIKIEDSLNKTILKKAIDVLIKNMLPGKLVDTKLLASVETFLFSDLGFDFDNLGKILNKYIKTENVQKVLETLKALKDDKLKIKLKIYEAIDQMMQTEISSVDLSENKEMQEVVKEVVNGKSCSLSHEYVIKILEQTQIPSICSNFVDTMFKETTNVDNKKSPKTQINNTGNSMNCIIEIIQKYKLDLDIEDKNPLRNIMRFFFDPDKIDKINPEAIIGKINEMLTEQIYTEMLEKRPMLILFLDPNFLHKKIVVDPNDNVFNYNVFKKTFLDINEHMRDDKVSLNGLEGSANSLEGSAVVWKFFLDSVSKDCDVPDIDNYLYGFILFAINNMNEFHSSKSALILILMLISKLGMNYLYGKIFPGDGGKDAEQKSPIKNLLGMLFKGGEPSYFAEEYLETLYRQDVKIIIDECEDSVDARDFYYAHYPFYWTAIAHILSNLKYKPECKNNFLYFFDLFDWKREKVNVGGYGYFWQDNCHAWLRLFDFVDPGFLYGNLDVIERYLTLCKKYSSFVNGPITVNVIKQICNYDNYLKYAAEPKLDKTNYFYTLLRYNEQCIKYIEPKFIFDHLKDEEMKYYYKLIRNNAISQVNDMYKYIRNKKYDNLEQQKKDIFLLIEVFPDAMSRYIDVEFLIDNWDTFDPNFKKECTDGEALIHFFDGLKNISDIKKMEEWYVYLLEMCPPGYYAYHEVMDRFVDNYDKFSDEGLKTCIDLYKQRGDQDYSCLLKNLFKRVNALDLEKGERIYCPQKAEKTLWLIKTFGATIASKHVDKEFLIKNLNDKDIGDTVKECIKLCVETGSAFSDWQFCQSLYDTATNESLFYGINLTNEEKQAQRKKIILDLINIGKEKIFEHVGNQFLLENLDNEMIKSIFGYTSEKKIISVLNSINNKNCSNDEKKKLYIKLIELTKSNPRIRMLVIYDYIASNNVLSEEDRKNIYLELIKCRPDTISCCSCFNPNQDLLKAAVQLILEKNVSFLSFLNYSLEEHLHGVNALFDHINKKPDGEKKRIINAMSCLDSPVPRHRFLSEDRYNFRNLAFIKYNLNDDLPFSLPLGIDSLGFNLFKIHNKLNYNHSLVDLVLENRLSILETIDFDFPEYHELSTIIKSSYKKYLWFIGILSFVLFAIFISCFWVEISVVYFVRYIPVMLFLLLMLDWINLFENKGGIVFGKIFLPLSLKGYETKIRHEKEARNNFYSYLNNKFDFKNYVYVYDEVTNGIQKENINVGKDFFDWLKTNKKDENFNKEKSREKKIDFVVDFILRAPNNEIIKKLDGVIETLEDFSNDNKAISLLDNWLNKNQNYNDCRDVLQSEFLDMIKFKSGELKIKLKRKDNIKTLAEKIYNQIIDPQDKKLDLSEKNNILIEEEIDTSEKNIIINNDQLEENNSIPMSEVKKGNQK